MSLKALSKQHLKRNQQRNHNATESCAGDIPDATAIWRAFYLEADRLYRQHHPGPEQMARHFKHKRYADTLLFLGLPQQANEELKMALDAITNNSATSAKELNK